MFSSREFGKIHDLEMFHQADKFEKNMNRLAMEKEAHKKVIIIVCIALFILIGLLIYIFRKNSILERKNKSLFELNLKVMNEQKEDMENHYEENQKEDLVESIGEESGGMDKTEEIHTNTDDSGRLKYINSGLTEEMATDIEGKIRKVMS